MDPGPGQLGLRALISSLCYAQTSYDMYHIPSEYRAFNGFLELITAEHTTSAPRVLCTSYCCSMQSTSKFQHIAGRKL